MNLPRLVKDINPGGRGSSPGSLMALNGRLLFSADEGLHGFELWSSDGSAAGTSLVKDLTVGASGSFPRRFTPVGSTMFFTANETVFASELWVSDGTRSGTRKINGVNPSKFSNYNLTPFKGRLYFTNGIDDELWSSDGTDSGTILVKTISPRGSRPRHLTAAGNVLYFSANDGTVGRELWKTDGTERGTVLVKDIAQGGSQFFPNESTPEQLTAVNNLLFFTANDGVTGIELWVSDGSVDGTRRVREIVPGNNTFSSSGPTNLTALGSRLFFTVNDGNSGTELWVSDGSFAGTRLVKDILPGPNGAGPAQLTAVDNILFFTANDGRKGRELWTSDGTTAGTVLVKDILAPSGPGFDGTAGEGPQKLKAINNKLYFSAESFTATGRTGLEPWVSDGTASGTALIADLQQNDPFFPGSEPSGFTAVGNQLFFSATRQGNGSELWALPLASNTQAAAVSLTLSPSAVIENGTNKLFYTFTRTGSTTAPLTARFTIGGTATPGVDYTGITSTASTRSVTIAAGSTTATIRLSPTPDRSQEANETISLRLVAGSGYTVGTTTAVTGTVLNDDLIGNGGNNTLRGTVRSEYLEGRQGKDTLTGGVGPDVFGFSFGDSTIPAPDRLTDFQFGVDKVDVLTLTRGKLRTPVSFSRAANNSTAATLSDLATAVFKDANGDAFGQQPLNAYAAALVVSTRPGLAGTYLFINDGTAARNSSNDLLIHLTGASGILPGLGVNPVSSVFA